MKVRPFHRGACVVLVVLAVLAGASAPAPAADDSVSVAELTPQADRAIQKGLEFLASSQHEDGSWGKQFKSAGTGLGLMAFMVKGHFPGRPPYGDKLAKAVEYLLKQSELHKGYMGVSMYEHALATLALSEVWGMSQEARVGKRLKEGVNVILRSQNPAGGWRYRPVPADADLSVTVMQLVALASAKEAGIVVPDAAIRKAIAYVLKCRGPKGGFGYTPGQAPRGPVTAAGVVSLMMCGQRDHKAVAEGLDWLEAHARQAGAGGHYFYAQYYAAQAMYQAGDVRYRQWYPRVRDELLEKQSSTGAWAGPHGVETQFAILVMGIPYRFLPIYQR